MYVVDSSARKATITLTGEEVAVKFPCTYSVFGIKGDNMLLYPKSGMAQGDDGVYDTAEGDGSVIMCLHYQADIVYIKGTGSCVIWAGNSPLDNPFSSTGKGGGGSGGDNTHYKGTTTTPISNGSTTNPIVIDGESYTAVFGDIVVYNYTEFVFDGATWSEFGRPFDTVPTSGSANAVTSDGIKTALDTKQNIMQYAAMPTITASMLGKVVQYVGASDSNYKQGWNYVAVSDGAAEPTYSWQALMDSVPTSGSNNPVTSGAVYRRTPFVKGSVDSSACMGFQSEATRSGSLAVGTGARAYNTATIAVGTSVTASQPDMAAFGHGNSPRTNDLFNIGNGTAQNRSNIFEVNHTSVNVNGDIQKNGVSLPTPYTTMPTITAAMLGQIAMYVGTTDANYTQGWFYIASSDGAAEPTYSWVHLPTQNGYSETVLYTASSPHTNNIELSQAYTNFDEIVIVWKYSSPDPDTVDNYSVRYTKAYKVSTFGDGVVFLCGEETSATQAFTAYTLGDTTHINYDSKIGTLYNWIAKVIGIKYGSNGGAVANPVRSLAKSEEKPIEEEEPTDEMR